jgi:hypothetical protein
MATASKACDFETFVEEVKHKTKTIGMSFTWLNRRPWRLAQKRIRKSSLDHRESIGYTRKR